MPASGTPWSPTYDFAGDPAPQNLLNAAALQVQLVQLAAYLAQLNISLERVIRDDDTLTDELVRIRNLHPELNEWLASLINGEVAAQALSWLYPVRVASVGVNIDPQLLQTIDGIALNEGDRVLLKDQTVPATNGLWIATAVGPGLWTRPADYAPGVSLTEPLSVIVREGTANAQTAWAVVTGETVPGGPTAPVIDADAVTFFPVWGPFPLPVAKGGTGATNATDARTNLGCVGIEAYNFTGNGVTSTWTFTHTLDTEDLIAQVKVMATGELCGATIYIVDNATVQVVFTIAPATGIVHRLILQG